LPTDEILAAQAVNGDMAAFEELMNRYKKTVFRIVYRMMGNFHEAEDISQDIFVTVYRKLYQFDCDKKFGAWITKIAVNTCITAMRRNKRVVVWTFEDGLIPEYDPEATVNHLDLERAFEGHQLRAELDAALLELPEIYRTVIILRYQLDLDNGEIAEILGVTRENVEVKVHRARKALRKKMLLRWDEGGQKHELPAL